MKFFDKRGLASARFEGIESDQSSWNTGDEPEQKIHRIHAYPAKFPAFITTKAVEYYQERRGGRPKQLADFFCGCGTSAFEARKLGVNYWGCDINPVATLIAKVKSSRKYKDKLLVDYFDKINRKFSSAKQSTRYPQCTERLGYWYGTKEFKDLYRLLKAIESVTLKSPAYRNFFYCAFSNILKPTSRWLSKSIKPQIDPDKTPAKVSDAFQKQVEIMRKANEDIDDAFGSRKGSEVRIRNINVLNKQAAIPEIDLLVTSPPYVTSYEYADLHQLSALWLNYADDYRDLRKGSIGSVQGMGASHKNLGELNETGQEIYKRLSRHSTSKAKSVARYFLDMQKVAKTAYRSLKKKGIALFVIGNTQYGEVVVNNAKHLAESLLDSGFGRVTIDKRKVSGKILTPYRDEKGKFSSKRKPGGREVYHEEFVVIGEK